MGLWPVVSHGIGARVKAHMVDVDEQWLTIQGRWPEWFVVLDVTTELPVLAALLPSRSQGACRWLGRQRRWLKNVPQVLMTDGWQADASLVPGAKHVWCRLHHQQGVTHWLKAHVKTDADMNLRKPAMKQVFQTRDQRTVRRRRARLTARAAAWGMTPWVTGVEEQRPQLLGRVGRTRRPSTTTAIARFFRACERFYTTRQGFHSVLSATREWRLFLVVDVFTQQATTGQAPSEGILPEARRRPRYRLINDPFRALQERAAVKPEAHMAELLLPKAAGA
jgi:hypothetical protein